MSVLTLRAFAKVNLSLHVLGRRSDGYHDIRSLAQTVTLHDLLELRSGSASPGLHVDDPAIPSGPGNLVCRAIERLVPGGPVAAGIEVRLSKRIPAGAGLGGGSSDAAAALVGANRLLDAGATEDDLLAHAAALGSDVPYFLIGGTALLEGRGTRVTPLADLPAATILIVHPRRPLSTRDVYAQIQEPLTLAAKAVSMHGFGRIPEDVESWVRAGNDLESPARRLCPEIGRIRQILEAAGATAAAMSGSGSAVFGVFRDAGRAEAAAREATLAGFATLPCRTLDRAGFLRGRLLS